MEKIHNSMMRTIDQNLYDCTVRNLEDNDVSKRVYLEVTDWLAEWFFVNVQGKIYDELMRNEIRLD